MQVLGLTVSEFRNFRLTVPLPPVQQIHHLLSPFNRIGFATQSSQYNLDEKIKFLIKNSCASDDDFKPRKALQILDTFSPNLRMNKIFIN